MDTLAPYQATLARSVLDSVLHGRNLRFTVQVAHGAGAEDVSAQLEFLLLSLHARVGGRLLKVVPASADPGLQRLVGLLAGAPLPSPWSCHGDVVRIGKATLVTTSPDHAVEARGPFQLIEVVQAQLTDNFALEALIHGHPQTTVVCYGVPWTGASAFERLAAENQEMGRADGLRRHFRVPWDVAAAQRPGYAPQVAAIRARLGADHPEFVTAYELRAAQPGTPLLPPHADIARGQGRNRLPVPGSRYVASVVLAGADDGAVVTIAEVAGPAAPQPMIHVVEHRWLVGPDPAALERGLVKLLGMTWRASAVAVGNGGRAEHGFPLGLAGLSATGTVLVQAEDSARAITRRAFGLLAAAHTGSLTAYPADGSPERSAFGHAVRTAVIQLLPGGFARLHSPCGGDAFLSGLALLADASEAAALPVQPGREPALAS